MYVPDWWKKSHENACWAAFEKWKKEAYGKINIEEALNPIHPLKLDKVMAVTSEQTKLLKQWDSVGDSVWDSVRASVGASVGDSVRDSVWDSVWDSVRASVRDSVWASVGASVRASVGDSVGDSVRASVGDSVGASVGASVWAYIGYLFLLERKEWKYTENIEGEGYPFQSLVDLWKQGLVPSLDGSIWRLHSGKKADIVFEISADRLSKIE
jgi:hypothetical protein